MRQSRFTETEIVYAVKQVELGIPVREIARKYTAVDDPGTSAWPRAEAVRALLAAASHV